jgi:hypothetical protein
MNAKETSPAPTVSSERLLAEKIVAELFRDGGGREANRLVLENTATPSIDGSGWCRGAARDVILRELAKWRCSLCGASLKRIRPSANAEVSGSESAAPTVRGNDR